MTTTTTGPDDGRIPRIAVLPAPAEGWAVAAVRRGGGRVVDADDGPDALVWTAPAGGPALADALVASPTVRWVQLPWAGVDAFAGHLRLFPDLAWTCAKGAYAAPVAEHALALALAVLRHLPERARARSWGEPAGRSLFGRPVTVVGGGGIAERFLTLVQPFGCETTVVRRTPDPFPGATTTATTAELHLALASADLVVLALALTPDTAGIIGPDELRLLAPRQAVLVNVARGAHVATDALVTALDEGWIGGAGLDVTDPEPLPAGHPLWSHPLALVTPHTADTAEMTRPLLAGRITENVGRFAAGRPLVGVVDVGAGY